MKGLVLKIITFLCAFLGLYVGFHIYQVHTSLLFHPDSNWKNSAFILEESNDTNINQENLRENWRYVSITASIYSAFWDNRDGKRRSKVVIIGMVAKNFQPANMECLLKYRENESLIIVPATFQRIPENHDSEDCATFFYCSSNDQPPIAVSLRLTNSNEVWIPVQVPPNGIDKSGRISVCVRPFFDSYNKHLQLAEFVAFYTLLGVTNFTFYNYEASSDIINLISNLVTAGYSIELRKWDLLEVGKHAWAYGQLASIQDCIYRSIGKFQYVVNLDVDEFIMPQIKTNLIEMIESVKAPKNTGSFNIRNIFFCLEYPSKPHFQSTTPELLTQTKIYRKEKIWLYNQRSKYILKPEALGIAGIHSMFQHYGHFRQFNVHTQVAVLNHYRECGSDCGKPELENNKSLRFGDSLINSKAIQVWKYIHQ